MAGKITQKLERYPNNPFEFDHNGQIKDLLIDLSIESKFKAGLEGERVQAVHYGEHPTHFILIVLWSGYADRNENGYLAWCFPKKRWSFEQFMEASRRILNPTDDRMLGGDIFSTRPGNPSN
jgi:hypothetical protein